MKDMSQQNIRKVLFMKDCESPEQDPEFTNWLQENKGEVLHCVKCKEGIIALVHFEPVFAENVVLQGSSSQPVPDSQPSLDLPVT